MQLKKINLTNQWTQKLKSLYVNYVAIVQVNISRSSDCFKRKMSQWLPTNKIPFLFKIAWT